MVTSKPSHPILQVLDSKKHVLQGMGAGKWLFRGHPTQNMTIFPQRTA